MITKIDTANAEIIPIASMPICVPVKPPSYFRSFKRLAPNITGTARKNVNSAATVLETPMRSEPTIVEPERDVPGKIAAIS